MCILQVSSSSDGLHLLVLLLCVCWGQVEEEVDMREWRELKLVSHYERPWQWATVGLWTRNDSIICALHRTVSKKKGEFQLDDALLRRLLVWRNFFVGDSNRNCLQKSRTLLLIYLDVRRQLTSVWLKGKRGDHLGGGQLRRRSSAKNKCPIVP